MQNEPKTITFEEDWFDKKTKSLWERHLLPIKDDVDSYLEIGVAEGRSMRWIIENLEPSRCVGVDPWIAPREQQREAFENYVQNAHNNLGSFVDSGQLSLHRQTSQDWLSSVNGSMYFDLIYVDGDHHGPEALLDMLLCCQLLTRPVMVKSDRRNWKMTRPGGRMVIDDLQRIYRSGKPLVLPAVQAFEMIIKGRCQREWQDERQICFQAIPVRSDNRA